MKLRLANKSELFLLSSGAAVPQEAQKPDAMESNISQTREDLLIIIIIIGLIQNQLLS